MKKNLYIVFSMFLVTWAFALEKTKEEKVAKFILENIQKDYTSCYAFYKVTGESFKKSGIEKSIIKSLENSADITLKFAHDLGEVLNINPKVMTKKNQIEVKKLSQIARKDFNQLTKNYGLLCKNLVENQKQRIDYWENKGNKKIK
jgi:hypothetical protein|tara:strand:+ start:96 stop:533 length:438 start_codon:yes stop_codon:yes gene_type:complete